MMQNKKERHSSKIPYQITRNSGNFEIRQYLSDANQFLKDEFNNILTLLTDPETRNKLFSIADALIGGKPVITSGGGGGSDSDFGWDGRRPDEEEEAYRRRCVLTAVKYVQAPSKRSYKR